MKIFTATSNEYAKFNGPVEVVRPLTSTEADLDETGPMFRCAKDGRHFDVFGDELTDPPTPMLVHIYDADERSLISENIDLRLAFPQGDGDLDYLAALYDLVENDRHFCGGGAAPAFLIIAAHTTEPLHVLTGDL